MVTKNSRQQVKRCLKSFLQWHIFTTFLLWINVRVKRSLGRHWGDWYWFMAACERLRRSGARGSLLLSLQELGRYWEVLWRLAQPRLSSNNNDLCWGWVVIDSCQPVASLTPMMGGDIGAARPGQGSLFRPDYPSRNVSPTPPCLQRDKQRDGHYIITETFIGQIRKSLLRRRKKDLSSFLGIWCL